MIEKASTPREYTSFEDGFKLENEIIENVNEHGTSLGKISTEALYNDRQAFWSYHERKIVMLMLFCSFYFMAVLV